MRKKPIDKLRASIGRRISEVVLEVWRDGRDVLCVGVKTEGNLRFFVLGCASNGGIFVRKSVLHPWNDHTVLVRLREMDGEVLRSVEVHEDRLRLTTEKHSLLLVNVFDELKVTISSASVGN